MIMATQNKKPEAIRENSDEMTLQKQLINLNDLTSGSESKQKSEWLTLTDLKNGRYSFGLWSVIIKNAQNGQQYLQHDGISKENLFTILHKAGYRKRYDNNKNFLFVKVQDNILDEVTTNEIRDFVINLIDTLPNEVEVCGFKLQKAVLSEKFKTEHVKLFSRESMAALRNHTGNLMRDTKTAMLLPFLNGVAKVTKKGVELVAYAEFSNICIWREHILKREFHLTDEHSMYADFIRNVCNQDVNRIHTMRVAIGAALCRHFTPTRTKAYVCYDEELADRDSSIGGTGKGIWYKALFQLRKGVAINGKTFNPNDRFALQQVDVDTQIVVFDDIKPDFDPEYLNHTITDGMKVEKKNQNILEIAPADSPTICIISNQIIKQKRGTTLSRRQFILEFSNFYSKLLATSQQPIVDVHGCEFFLEWDSTEWQRFDNFMLESCRLFLEHGLPVNKTINVAINLLLQLTCPEFMEWMEQKKFTTDVNYEFGRNFDEFKSLHMGENSLFSQSTFIKWLKLYAETVQMKYISFRFNNLTYFKFE